MAKIKVSSFGFKYGEPYPDTDIRIDLRKRLANPKDHLPKGAIGTDAIVREAVLGPDKNRKIFESYLSRAKKLAKNNAKASISFGCMSGIHRSVVFAEEMAARLEKLGHHVELVHVHLVPRRDA